MPEMFTAADLETMQWVREVFDQKNLANPTKVLPSPRTCGEGAKPQPSNPQFQEIPRF
jgi:glycolate oxidase